MTFGTEFWSAIAGAVVGGVIAFVVQLIALHDARKVRLEDRSERRKASGRSLLFKTMRITSDAYHLSRHIEDAYAAVDPSSHSEPYAFVLPFANFPAYVHFTDDEMALALSFENDKLFNDLMSLDVIHNSAIDAFRTHLELRTALLEKMPAEMNGTVGTTTLTTEQFQLLRPRMIVINELVRSLRTQSSQNYSEAKVTLQTLQGALKANLGFNVKLELPTN